MFDPHDPIEPGPPTPLRHVGPLPPYGGMDGFALVASA